MQVYQHAESTNREESSARRSKHFSSRRFHFNGFTESAGTEALILLKDRFLSQRILSDGCPQCHSNKTAHRPRRIRAI